MTNVSTQKVIYYAWFGGKEESDNLRLNKKTWAEYLPGYEIRRIDESNYDVNKHPFTKEAYAEKAWAFVSDFARYDVIKQNGGVYLDVDVKLIKRIDDLVKLNDSVWALENSNSIASGLFFSANKGNQHLENILNIYENLHFDPDNVSPLITTKIVTTYFLSKGFKIANRKQEIDGATFLPTPFFAPFHWWGGGKITSKTRGVHEYDASWKVNGNLMDHKRNYLTSLKFSQDVMLYVPNIYPILSYVKRRFKKRRIQ